MPLASVSPHSDQWNHPRGCPQHRAAGVCYEGQTLPLFPVGESRGRVQASIHTLLHNGVWAPSSPWAGATLVRPGWAVRLISRNSAVPMGLPTPAISTREVALDGGAWKQGTEVVAVEGGLGGCLPVAPAAWEARVMRVRTQISLASVGGVPCLSWPSAESPPHCGLLRFRLQSRTLRLREGCLV